MCNQQAHLPNGSQDIGQASRAATALGGADVSSRELAAHRQPDGGRHPDSAGQDWGVQEAAVLLLQLLLLVEVVVASQGLVVLRGMGEAGAAASDNLGAWRLQGAGGEAATGDAMSSGGFGSFHGANPAMVHGQVVVIRAWIWGIQCQGHRFTGSRLSLQTNLSYLLVKLGNSRDTHFPCSYLIGSEIQRKRLSR